MTALSGMLYKLVAGGMVCAGLLSLGGKGGQKAIIRFGCACLMVVLLLSLLRQTPLPSGSLEWYETEMQNRVDQAQRDNRQTLLAQTIQTLQQELERQAAALSLDCTVQVICTADSQGRVTVQRVTVFYRGGPRSSLQDLRQTVAAQLAVPLEHITIQEESIP